MFGTVRVGVNRSFADGKDGEPQWIEIDGVRLTGENGIFSIEHLTEAGKPPIVTVKLFAGRYETVPATKAEEHIL